MKAIPQPLRFHIQGSLTSLSLCWKLTRRDGTVLAFTDAAADLAVQGLTYLSVTGYQPTAIESSASMSVDNMEVDGLLNSNAFTESDLSAGLYDGAEVQVFFVNRQAPADGLLTMKRGYIGQISWEQGKFKAEIRGMLQPFQQNVVEVFSKTCRATLGDSRCKVDLLAMTATGAVATTAENRTFTDPARAEAEGRFAYGLVNFTSGACKGLSMEVKTFKGGVVELLLPMPGAIVAGDTYTISAGCDRLVSTCRDTFKNILNFRGEPDIPDPTTVMYPA
ncbi:MAG: DUF2163 domain-containing protein [Pseudomonadota bacterium]|nr:DUF2163 domain-containing protein [Pseudomonadota bacterium]